MILRDLIAHLDRPLHAGPLDTDIRAVTSDSRLVEPGVAFVAVRGESRDGREFIPMALERGAAVIISDTAPETGHPAEIPYIQVSDTRHEPDGG